MEPQQINLNIMASTNVVIRLKNNGQKIELPMGCTLMDVFEKSGIEMPLGPVSARVNNKVQGLKYRFYNNKDVEFLDLTSPSGIRVYER